jgi:hypothetical protein
MREMDMAGQRERLQRFGPSELSIGSTLVRNYMKIVSVCHLFQLQSRPGDGVSHERYRNIHWSSTISGSHKIRGR